ncbi:MAG: helix-turn-helix domain-containing protein [Evtepia sp.]
MEHSEVIRYSAETKAARRVLWGMGKTDREIADAEGVSRNTISSWRKQEKLPIHSTRKKGNTKQENPKTVQSNTLCWSCQNACGGCEWSSKEQVPVAGWTATQHRREGGDVGYNVTHCPKYKQDEPRSIL